MGKRIRRMDGRTWQARLGAEVRAKLSKHVGGHPSPVEAALIERAAMLTVYVNEMDLRAAQSPGRSLSQHDSNQYLAWSNSLQRCLALLGNAPAPSRARTLADHLAQRQAAAA